MGEKVNLVARYPEKATALAVKLEAWRKETGAITPIKNPDADPAWPGFQLTGDEKANASGEIASLHWFRE